MSSELYLEYGSAIRSLSDARLRYAEVCKDQGSESWAAEQAKGYLDREMQHRDKIRDRYDAARKALEAPSG